MQELRSFLRRAFFRLVVFSGGSLGVVHFSHKVLRLEAQVQVWASARLGSTSFLHLEDLRKELAPMQPTTLFILGSGPSANSLSEDQLRYLRRGFSIGLNPAKHPGSLRANLSLEEKLDSSELEELAQMGEGRILSHVSNRHQIFLRKSASGRKPWNGNKILAYNSANIWSSNPSVVAQIFVASCQKSKRWTRSVTGGSQASLLRAVWLALYMGFDEIVLVGVDLSTEICGTLVPHYTAMKRRPEQIPVVELMRAIRSEVRFQSMGEIYLGLDKGLLRDHLPLYEWPPCALED